jgi:prepilin-type N-terminal cleavage/methylation domain-containing protein
MKMKNSKKGFTLIELLIYVSLVSLFLTGAIMFLWDTIYIKEKALRRNSEVYEALTAHGKANYWANYSNSAQDFINQLDFPNSIKEDKSTDNTINVKMKLKDSESAWELIQPDLEARSLLMNLCATSLTSTGEDLVGMEIRNTNEEEIIIDKIYLEWENTAETANVTEIQINGGDIEWSGAAPSESTIDIIDVILFPDTDVDVNYLRFDGDMSDGTLALAFIMQDKSKARGELDLMAQEGEGGTGATPCSQWCEDLEYSYGTCEQNAQQCISNGGTHEPGADELCTGGANADTCCCMP